MTKALVDDCPERMNMGTQNAERLCLDYHLSGYCDYNQQTFECEGEDDGSLQLSKVGEEIPLVEAPKWEGMVVDPLYGCYTLWAPVAYYIVMKTLALCSKDFRIHSAHWMKVIPQVEHPVFDVSYSELGDFDQHCYIHNLQLQT